MVPLAQHALALAGRMALADVCMVAWALAECGCRWALVWGG